MGDPHVGQRLRAGPGQLLGAGEFRDVFTSDDDRGRRAVVHHHAGGCGADVHVHSPGHIAEFHRDRRKRAIQHQYAVRLFVERVERRVLGHDEFDRLGIRKRQLLCAVQLRSRAADDDHRRRPVLHRHAGGRRANLHLHAGADVSELCGGGRQLSVQRHHAGGLLVDRVEQRVVDYWDYSERIRTW